MNLVCCDCCYFNILLDTIRDEISDKALERFWFYYANLIRSFSIVDDAENWRRKRARGVYVECNSCVEEAGKLATKDGLLEGRQRQRAPNARKKKKLGKGENTSGRNLSNDKEKR